jgi:FixJ family two-component response regulator
MSEIPLTAVVDDDEAIREAVQSLIRSAGFSAEAFPSAEGFLEDAEMRAGVASGRSGPFRQTVLR